MEVQDVQDHKEALEYQEKKVKLVVQVPQEHRVPQEVVAVMDLPDLAVDQERLAHVVQ